MRSTRATLDACPGYEPAERRLARIEARAEEMADVFAGAGEALARLYAHRKDARRTLAELRRRAGA